ncbi:cytochrome P450 [Picosynechococcus sp. NKBG15041c]|uniref:cytochrome P450 n=1 Tax=Picosynechococcus sp. NKBG15041c TaxID=1407650 RepID=UPI0003FDFA9E|nr:cytochrome P450 [Picosynechococcus sp. NKBG15041c]
MIPQLPLPPGRNGLPFVGETLAFIFDPDFAEKRANRYGAIFRTNILGQPTVVMSGPEANKLILSTHFEHFSWREGWPANFRELLGESLFLQDGAEHRRNRKLLMPAFHGAALQNYFVTMEAIATRHLETCADLGDYTWLPLLKEMTFEIASVLLVGGESGPETSRLSEIFTALTQGLFAFPIRLPFTTYGKALKARDQLLKHIEQAIASRRQNPRNDALGLLLQSRDEDGNALSDAEIKVQALLMLFAGHETTTSMLISAAMALAQNPKVLAQARQEQAQFSEPLDFEQLKQMPYLSQILKEVERLYPPVAGGFRGVVKPFEFGGYHIPAGWKVLYQVKPTHRSGEIYSNPDVFDPDRFSPERNEYKNAEFSLVGFGGGARVCLGLAFAQLEMKIFLALLLRSYDWELLPGQDLSLDRIPSLHPRSGLQVKLTRR